MKEAQYSQDINGLARQCPRCNIVAHYNVKGKKVKTVACPDCEFEFEVQRYKRGQRPRARRVK